MCLLFKAIVISYIMLCMTFQVSHINFCVGSTVFKFSIYISGNGKIISHCDQLHI